MVWVRVRGGCRGRAGGFLWYGSELGGGAVGGELGVSLVWVRAVWGQLGFLVWVWDWVRTGCSNKQS